MQEESNKDLESEPTIIGNQEIDGLETEVEVPVKIQKGHAKPNSKQLESLEFEGKRDKRFIPEPEVWKRGKPVRDPSESVLKDHSRSILTFQVPNGEVYCFSEEFREIGVNYTFEYKVLRGDVVQSWINNPQYEHIFSSTKNRDIFSFFSLPGLFTFCFANENYLTLEHKIVFMRLEKTAHDPMFVRRTGEDRPGPFGLEETVCDEIYESLLKERI